nr:SDR family oxidoreductase [uncultured Acidocella sp.]
MRIFVTGATGFIGSALVKELILAGHEVTGLYRDEAKRAALEATGARALHGDMKDYPLLTKAAAEADAVAHLAFNHDFSTFMANCEDDRHVVAALGAGLAGSKKPLIVTSGTGIARNEAGEVATEAARPDASVPRAASEEAARALADQGGAGAIMRLPQVHDPRRQGLVSYYIQLALQHGYLAIIGEGTNRWPAAARADVARLYRLALEAARPGAVYHAVAEEGVAMRDIARVLSAQLKLPVKSITPEEAQGYFGWLAMFAGHDMPASSAWTRATLGWTPTGPTMLEDLARLELETA